MFNLTSSLLYDQTTFYKAFLRDLKKAKTLVIIESPFITEKRMKLLILTLMALRHNGVCIIVNTKTLEEHSLPYKDHTLRVIASMQNLDIEVLRTVGHHRKLAIIDNDILWEGSLNILSQNDSCELMRRIKSNVAVKEMVMFTKNKKWC